jgi:acetolactate synthase-1/3 small subunit
MLIRVSSPTGEQRGEVLQLTEVFRGKIVDVARDALIIEISGPERKVDAFIELMRPFGIIELCRTGRIAMVRGVHRPAENAAEPSEEA